MLFAVMCTDRPGGLDLRMATRSTHLAYLEQHAGKVVSAGAMLDQDGKPCGSLIVLEATDRGEAEAFAAKDPYGKSGLFESTVIRPFRQVYKDGMKIAP
jgi:uncharacterized protein YciI